MKKSYSMILTLVALCALFAMNAMAQEKRANTADTSSTATETSPDEGKVYYVTHVPGLNDPYQWIVDNFGEESQPTDMSTGETIQIQWLFEGEYAYLQETADGYDLLTTKYLEPQGDDMDDEDQKASCDTATNRCNCVFYARCLVPSLPYGLDDCAKKNAIINSTTPKVGYVAIHNINQPYCHVSVVTAVYTSGANSGKISITEANYQACKVSTRLGRPVDLKITGYFKPLAASPQETSVLALPTITSIGGYSDGVGVSLGRWTGQPSTAPPTASNMYKTFLASDSYNYGSSSNPYYWDINGSNFGSTQGSIIINPQPSPFISISIVSWSATKIRVKVAATKNFTNAAIQLIVVTSTGLKSVAKSDNVVGIIKSRGFGQCTWYVAKKRLDNSLAIPPSAYSTTSTIPAVGVVDNGYRPAQWDCLVYNGNHVSIITSNPTLTNNTDGSQTYTFQVGEYNATWNEALSTSTRTFKLSKINTTTSKRTILGGIGTNASSKWVATGYYR